MSKVLDRMARKLAKTPEGRHALKQYGVNAPEPRMQMVEKPLPRVAILIPSYKAPHPWMQESLTNMVRYSRSFADIFIPARLATSVVHITRNRLLGQLIQTSEPFDYVLYVDDDMVIAPDSLKRLMSWNRDVTAGLCTKRTDPPIPNIKFLDSDMNYHEILKWETKSGLLEVDAVGTGMMLISRKAIEAVAEFHLRCGYERLVFGSMFNDALAEIASEEDKHLAAARLEQGFQEQERERRERWKLAGDASIFQFLQHPHSRCELGEDVSFCFKAKLCGMGIFVDTAVCPGHVGDYTYSIEDFLYYQAQLLAPPKPGETNDAKRSNPDGPGLHGTPS